MKPDTEKQAVMDDPEFDPVMDHLADVFLDDEYLYDFDDHEYVQ